MYFLLYGYIVSNLFIHLKYLSTLFIVVMIDGTNPDSKVHGAKMGFTLVLSAQRGPYVGPTNLAIREVK